MDIREPPRNTKNGPSRLWSISGVGNAFTAAGSAEIQDSLPFLSCNEFLTSDVCLILPGCDDIVPIPASVLHGGVRRALFPADPRHERRLLLHHLAALVQALPGREDRVGNPGPEQGPAQG